jgi:hypothetical protein
MRFKILLVLMMISIYAKAQIQEDEFIKDLIESLAENLPEDFDISEYQDRLNYYQKNPINLNKTNYEELNGLLFLSPLQISNLFYHIKNYGKLIDVLELQSIPEFDDITIKRILPFVGLNQNDLGDPITLKNIKNFGKHDLLLRFGQVTQTAKGYTDLPGSKYLGTPERLLLRYKFTYSNRISAAIIAEKDAGENLFGGVKQYPFDYQSAHLAILNTGKFKKIIVGDFTMQFGQGLTLWSGFAFGKAPDVTSVAKRDVGLKPYTSTNEFSFFRGAATTINLFKNIDFTAFISFRKLDASLSLNGLGEQVLSTINETGLHRTPTEILNKNSVSQKIYGSVLQYQTNNFSIGLIGYHTKFDKTFVTTNAPYTFNNFIGDHLTNVGAHYNYTFKNIYIFGEVGHSLNSGFGMLNGVLMSLTSKISAVFLQRNYSPNYHNFFNQATAEGSRASNEKGFYSGLNFTLSRHWTFAFYADYFRFPWLKFRVDAPSKGNEVLGQLNYTPSKTLKAFLRYKYEIKEQNTDLTVPINFLDEVKRSSYRGDVSWKLGKTLKLQNRIEISQFKKGSSKAEFGFLTYQDIAYAPLFSKITANIRLAYFNTSSFNSRIYAYEDDVLYNFNFGIYNGKGFRTYLNMKYKLSKKLDVWARYALFFYPNTNTVGSGLEEIAGNKKTDVKLQMRYQF